MNTLILPITVAHMICKMPATSEYNFGVIGSLRISEIEGTEQTIYVHSRGKWTIRVDSCPQGFTGASSFFLQILNCT